MEIQSNESFEAHQSDSEYQNDPIYKQLGGIPLACLDDPEKYFQEGVLRYKFINVNLRAGTMFGELALITKKPRAATIIAQQDSEFATLDVKSFSKIFEIVQKQKIEVKNDFFQQNFLQEFGREQLTK